MKTKQGIKEMGLNKVETFTGFQITKEMDRQALELRCGGGLSSWLDMYWWWLGLG